MRKLPYTYLSFIIVFASLSACTIQKRTYRPGYHIEWRMTNDNHTFAKSNVDTHDLNDNHDGLLQTLIPDDSLENVLSASTEPIIFSHGYSAPFIKDSNECDMLVYLNSYSKKVKVVEITENKIKFKKCNSADSPIYEEEKSDISAIIFSNGVKETRDELFNKTSNLVNDSIAGFDTVIFKSSIKTKVRVSLIDLSRDEITYKKHSNLFGPNYKTDKLNIDSILFSNGTYETFDYLQWQDTLTGFDTIFFKPAGYTKVKIIHVSNDSIRFKKSNNLTGTEYVVHKGDVYSINYSNGNKVQLNSPDIQRTKIEKTSLGGDGLAYSLLGLLIAGFIFGTIGIVQSSKALRKIKKEPQKYSGKGKAIAGIIIGILAIIGSAIAIAILLG